MRLRCLFPLVPILATAFLPAGDARADDPEADRGHLTVDPVADGAVIATGAGFSTLLGLVISTGEIQPLKAGSESALLGIDRIAVTQKIDPNAGLYSDIGLYGAVGFAALDSLSSGLQHRWNATLVDAVMYSESLTLALAFDDIVKIAVRRPRPIDYAPENANNTTNTDLALSFFSGHAAVVAAMSATATYLAFVHSPRSPRPWITLAAGTLLTAFVGYERIRAGEHFPTDIMMGALGGAATGVLVPHMHRTKSASAPVWIDLAPASRGTGASLGVHGLF
jgi:hypothetical protein